MIDVFVIHGSFGSPFQNWAPWLHTKLSELGKTTLVPHFTSGSLQNFDSWATILDGYSNLIGENTTFVAHSLAPAFCVDWISTRKKPIGKLVAVAPFYSLIGISEFDEVNQSFFLDEELITKASDLIAQRVCVFSDNDPYVPTELSDKFTALLSADKKIVPGGGHLNAGAGYTEFPMLLDIITQ